MRAEMGVAVDRRDVVMMGTGLSGIGAGWHSPTRCLDRANVVLEARDAIGAMLGMARYPGIRSVSDRLTLGYSGWPSRNQLCS